jgi:4-amino-4-deoxy-L-arabinose transferase-like glycosyltransferase
VVVVALGLALRLIQLGEWSFWQDEAVTVLLARKPVVDLIRITSQDVHPPLYYLVVKTFMFLGQSEWVVRLPSALCSTMSVAVLYWIGCELFERRTALVAAGLMAVSPLQLYYAQEARMYAQLVFLSLFCVGCLVRALQTRSWLWWGLLSAGAVLAVYTSYFAFPVLLVLFVYVLLVRRRAWFRFMIAMGIAALIFLPWVGVLLAQTRSVLDSYWMQASSFLEVFTTLASFFMGYSLSLAWQALGLGSSLFIIFVLLNSVRYALKEKSLDVEPLVLVLLWAWMPMIGVYLLTPIRPIFQIRTVMTSAPAFYLLVAWGLTRAKRTKLHWALFAPTALTMLVAAWGFYANPIYAKPNWREPARYVDERARPGDVVMHTSVGSFLPTMCYDHSVEHVLLQPEASTIAQDTTSWPTIWALTSRARSMDDSVAGYDRGWLIVGLDRAVEQQLAQKERFDEQYELLQEAEIAQVHVYLYALR